MFRREYRDEFPRHILSQEVTNDAHRNDVDQKHQRQTKTNEPPRRGEDTLQSGDLVLVRNTNKQNKFDTAFGAELQKVANPKVAGVQLQRLKIRQVVPTPSR